MPPIYKYSKILKQYINPDELPNMNIYDPPNYPDSPQTENDSFELGKLQEVPEYPYHYLMVENMPNLTTLLLVWAKMDRHLREFTVAIWETIDILVSTLLLQDPGTGRQCSTSYMTQIGCTQKKVALLQSTFNSLLIAKLFDAQAEDFGLRMFNLLKVIEPPDVLGALSHGLETISITEITKLKEMVEEKEKLIGLDVHIVDMKAQNICRR